MSLLIVLAFVFFCYAIVQTIRALILLFKAVYYYFLGLLKKDNLVDRGFEKHVIKPSDGYKKFEKGFDEEIDNIINPKRFWL